jgi:hypothetical protein
VNKNKKKEQKKNNNICRKIKQFFLPDDFRHEMRKGLYLGSHSKLAPNSETGNPGIIWFLPWTIGKLIRRIVDPKHKLKIGSTKTNDSISNNNNIKSKDTK